MAPQVLIMVMMGIRLAAIGLEHGFPEASSLGLDRMTPLRWGMVLLAGLSFVATLGASVGCLAADVSHRTTESQG